MVGATELFPALAKASEQQQPLERRGWLCHLALASRGQAFPSSVHRKPHADLATRSPPRAATLRLVSTGKRASRFGSGELAKNEGKEGR